MLLHLRRLNSEMGRFKYQESLRRGLVKKQDTPVKMAPSARSGKKNTDRYLCIENDPNFKSDQFSC